MRPDFIIDAYWDLSNSNTDLGKTITSKARAVNHENYFIIGPYNSKEFIEQKLPLSYQPAFDELKNLGITCYYGKIHNAKAILIDFSKFLKIKTQVKEDLWTWFKIDSVHSSSDFVEKAVFGYAAGMLIERLLPSLNFGNGILNCHNWQTASCLLYAKANKLKLATIYSISSTALGDKLKELNIDFENIDSEKESYKHSFESKYQLEKAAAFSSNLVTAISEHSAIEASKILKINPKLIIPSGIDNNAYPNTEESTVKLSLAKLKLKEFVGYYFFPYYTFNFSDTLFFFVSGDMDSGLEQSVRALSELNKKLKDTNKTIVTFFFMPSFSKGIKSSLKANISQFYSLKYLIDEHTPQIKDNLLDSILTKNLLQTGLLSLISSAKKITFQSKGSPLLTTHDLAYEKENSLLNMFRKYKLLNKKEDMVKVVFYPHFPSLNDNLLNLDYRDLIAGFNLGIFPSNNLGYMPLEAMALSVPAITTDRHFSRLSDKPGHSVLSHSNWFAESLTEELYDYVKMPMQERIKLKLAAKNSALSYDWSKISKLYDKAYFLAYENFE